MKSGGEGQACFVVKMNFLRGDGAMVRLQVSFEVNCT